MPEKHPVSPDEQEIEALLRGFRPRPEERFYQRMQSAPWQKRPLLWGRRRLASLGLALLVVIAVGVLTSPGLYALGEQLWRFFIPEQGDRLVIPLDTPGVIFSGELDSPQEFPLTLGQAQEAAGYRPKVLDGSGDLALSGMRYEPVTRAVRSLYQMGDYNLYLTQRPAKGIQEQAAVGPAAAIETVTVDGLPGEYVSGGWRLPDQRTPMPEPPALLDVTWDASLPQRTLRWQDEEFSYELRAVGAAAPEKQGLIALAERLK